jgi:hypothetical protein
MQRGSLKQAVLPHPVKKFFFHNGNIKMQHIKDKNKRTNEQETP